MEGMKVEVQRWLVEAVVDSVESSVKNSVMGFAAHLFLKAVEKVWLHTSRFLMLLL